MAGLRAFSCGKRNLANLSARGGSAKLAKLPPDLAKLPGSLMSSRKLDEGGHVQFLSLLV